MEGMEGLDTENLEHCTRCGFCLPVCPTYRDSGVEAQSPRGRVNLIRAAAKGELPWVGGVAEHMYHCLYCMACEGACPSGVHIAHHIAGARAIIEAKRPQPWLKTLVLRHLLPYPGRLELVTWPLRLYQNLGLRTLARVSGILRVLPRRWRHMEASLPSIPWRPLRRSLPTVIRPQGEARYRVGFFLGCVMSLFFARASKATVRVLQENGCLVITPKRQKCCGAPHESEGDVETLRQLARHNVDLFLSLEVDFIVADCAACSATTKAYGRLLQDDPKYKDKAREFSAKVRDITEFLAQIPLKEPLHEVRQRVTYHEACHLCHAQGISREPRSLLDRVPGLERVELPEANWCCGGAGSYVLTHYPRAETVLQHKLDNLEKTRAQVVVTSNPGCLLQLQGGVARRGLKVRVAHVSQILEEAYLKR